MLSAGNVGIGTTTDPTNRLQVDGSQAGLWMNPTGLGTTITYKSFAGGTKDLEFDYESQDGTTSTVMTLKGNGPLSGNVGIGTETPQTKLDVDGVIRSSSGGIEYPDGTVQTTATLVGPAGPTGPAGPAGSAGPAGPTGPMGDAPAAAGRTRFNDLHLELVTHELIADAKQQGFSDKNSSSSVWQSFTAGQSGQLAAVDIHRTSGEGTALVTLYAGEGLGGAVLATAEATNTSSWCTAAFGDTIEVAAGSLYTIHATVEDFTEDLDWSYTSGNPYAGGHSSSDSNYDQRFRVWLLDPDEEWEASLTVDSRTGNIGIGTINPQFALHVVGDAAKPGGGSWSTTSDARLKQNIEPLADALDQVLALRGVTYEYIDAESLGELSGERIGMIAQEVEEVFPDWVHVADDGYRRLTIRGFEALTVEAMRELNERNAALEARVAELESMQSELAAMKATLAAPMETR